MPVRRYRILTERSATDDSGNPPGTTEHFHEQHTVVNERGDFFHGLASNFTLRTEFARTSRTELNAFVDDSLQEIVGSAVKCRKTYNLNEVARDHELGGAFSV